MVTAIEGKTFQFPLFGRETTPTAVQQRWGRNQSFPTCGEQRRPCDFAPRLKGHSTGMCVLAMKRHHECMMECFVVLHLLKKTVHYSLSLKSRNMPEIWNIIGILKFLLTGSMFGAKKWSLYYPWSQPICLAQCNPAEFHHIQAPQMRPEHHPIEKEGWKSQAWPESPTKIWWKLVQILVNDYDKGVAKILLWQFFENFGPPQIFSESELVMLKAIFMKHEWNWRSAA